MGACGTKGNRAIGYQKKQHRKITEDKNGQLMLKEWQALENIRANADKEGKSIEAQLQSQHR